MKNICKDCGKCCEETEMLLSLDEIHLIESIVSNMRKEDFAELNDEGLYQLKNKNNSCIFFDNTSKLCKIYEIRPQGCRYYPIIYDNERKKCIYDVDCPRVSGFYLESTQFRIICKKIIHFITTQLKINNIKESE